MVLAYSSRARQASLCCFVAACLLSRSCVLCYGPTWGGQRQNPVGAPKNVPDADLPDDMEETVRVQLEIESKSDEELGQEELKRVMDNMFKKEQPKSKASMPSNALWLKQVQQNPSKFLRKKFQQEYINAQK